MTLLDFLSLLNRIDFSRRYWDLCDRFPVEADGKGSAGRKEDVLKAFALMGVTPSYDPRGPSFTFEEERIGAFVWLGTFVKQKTIAELIFFGKADQSTLGSNFAVMAYDAKRLADPTFTRDRFSGPPPYPRPSHNGDLIALQAIVKMQIDLVREIKAEIKKLRGMKLGRLS